MAQNVYLKTSDWLCRVVLAVLFSVFLPVTAAHAVQTQLDQNCVVSVLNRNVQVNADGTWVLPNIPANFGRVRARATCVENGVTTSGQSDFFSIPANGSVNVPRIALGPTTPIPTSMNLTAPNTTLTSAGATAQLTVTATYPSGPAVNVTASSTGTAYLTSNPAIASVTQEGLVTAVRSGTAFIQATNEGAQGILKIQSVFGTSSANDGIPDDWKLRYGFSPADPTVAQTDSDHDGLTNQEEFQRGTDPTNADTDGDGISDGDEVHCKLGYCTNPLLADSDSDGIRDKTEIQTGSDPTNPNSYNLNRALSSMEVTPANFTMIVNSINGVASAQLSLTGHVIDGTTIDLTGTGRGTNYASSNLGVCNFGTPDGRVFASSAGNCTITITNSGFTATANGTVQTFGPTTLSYVSIPGFANDVAVSGDYAFVAAGSAGLQIVGLSADRTSPSIVSRLNLSGNANAVSLVGNIAYVAAGNAGLHVVDLADPTSPRLLGSFNTVGNALGVKVVGTTAFVANGSNLAVVNVANPAAMISVSTVSLSGTVWNLDIDPNRNLAAVAAGSSGVYLIDISNVAAPVRRGSIATGDARGVALRGNYAIVADYANSMRSLDITNPASPSIVSTTDLSLGGRLQDVVLSENFALGADVYFVNGVPIVDITDPRTLQPRTILNFPARDDNGMGIAIDSSFVYLVTEHSSLDRGGSSGDSRLYIGQFQPRVDLAGVPPTASITSPATGTVNYQGSPLTVSVQARDDVAVAAVQFLVNGQVAFTTTSTPYQYAFTIPTGIDSLTLGAKAIDLGGNVGTATNVVLSVIPDPLTLVSGRVVDTSNTPLSGATINAPGGLTGITGSDGRFSIASVPTVLGNIFINASYTAADGSLLTGTSASIAPVRGGVTDVGTTSLIAAQFEANYGTYLVPEREAPLLL